MRITTAKIIQKLRQATNLVREKDFGGLALLFAGSIPKSIFYISRVVITRSQSIPNFPSPQNVLFRRLHPSELLPVDSLPLSEWDSAEALQRWFTNELAHHRDGFVATLGEKVIAYAWVAYSQHHIPEVKFNLPLEADEACTYKSYVDPQYRLSRVYAGLAKFIFTDLRQRGIRWFVGYGDHYNRHSIRTHQRMGYEIVGWIMLVEFLFLSLQLRRLRSESDRFCWSFGLRSRKSLMEPYREDYSRGLAPP